VFAGVSDIHADANDESMTGVSHCAQGVAEINNTTQLDLVVNLGDIVADKLGDAGEETFKYVRQCFADVRKSVPVLQMQGNHDNIIDKTISFDEEMAQEKQKYFAFIGANNVCGVVDYANKFRNYGYIDFPNHKIRVVYINSVDIVGLYRGYKSTCDFSEEQISWLVKNALVLSDKGEDEANWGVILFTHHPLNWSSPTEKLQVFLKAFANKTSGTMSTAYKQDADGNRVATSVAYNFTANKAEFIAHFHGHLHNFRVDKFGDNEEIVSVTIPNACAWRNNYYGADEEYVASHPDDPAKFGDTDENGNQRVFEKVSNTAEDTSFDIVVVNRETRKINCYNYGAGVDREISY
jgi:Icc-related predicted phosphoesterase